MKLDEFLKMYKGTNAMWTLYDVETDASIEFETNIPLEDSAFYMAINSKSFYLWRKWLELNLDVISFTNNTVTVDLYTLINKPEYIKYAAEKFYSNEENKSDESIIEFISCDIATNNFIESDVVSQQLLNMVNSVSKVKGGD